MNQEAQTEQVEQHDQTDYQELLYKRQHHQLVEDGYLEVNEYGEGTLTEKGKLRVANRLDKLPAGDEILIQIAVLQEHGIPVVTDMGR